MGLVCSNLQWPLLVTWWCMTEMGRLHQCATKMRGKGMQKKQNTVEFSMYRCRNLKKSHWSCKRFSQIIVRWELWVLYYYHDYYYYYYYHHLLLRYKITPTLQNPQQSIHWSYGEPMGTIAWWKRCGTPGLLGEIVGAMWWTKQASSCWRSFGFFNWLVLNDQQMSKRWPCSRSNQQMRHWLGLRVEHQPVN